MSKPWPIRVDATTEGEDAGFLRKCEAAWKQTDATVIGYLHSDLFIHENNWDVRVMQQFDDPRVAVVGFVGATGLAHEDIYKVSYAYTQLARSDVWSNLSDAEAHGQRETGARRVAVIDSCAVFVRRDVLSRLGGWSVDRYPNSSHCSDLWICCAVHRLGLSVHMVGISCTHRSGGRGATGESWLAERGGDRSMHQEAHVKLYEDMRDVLPIRIKQ